MAVRVTETEVLAIIPDDLESSDDITPQITAANAVIDATISSSDSVSSDLLKEMERYLSAHFVYMTILRQAKSVAIGGEDRAEEKYGDLGLNLDATTYGQMVKMLDPTGKMDTAGKRAASITAVTSFE